MNYDRINAINRVWGIYDTLSKVWVAPHGLAANDITGAEIFFDINRAYIQCETYNRGIDCHLVKELSNDC